MSLQAPKQVNILLFRATSGTCFCLCFLISKHRMCRHSFIYITIKFINTYGFAQNKNLLFSPYFRAFPAFHIVLKLERPSWESTLNLETCYPHGSGSGISSQNLPQNWKSIFTQKKRRTFFPAFPLHGSDPCLDFLLFSPIFHLSGCNFSLALPRIPNSDNHNQS